MSTKKIRIFYITYLLTKRKLRLFYAMFQLKKKGLKAIDGTYTIWRKRNPTLKSNYTADVLYQARRLIEKSLTEFEKEHVRCQAIKESKSVTFNIDQSEIKNNIEIYKCFLLAKIKN